MKPYVEKEDSSSATRVRFAQLGRTVFSVASLISLHAAVSVFVAGGLTRVASAQKASSWGADLFAPSEADGERIDSLRNLQLTPFYSSPVVNAPAAPGTLVRSELATDYSLPAGVTAIRILYHTLSAKNEDVLSSGVVLVPYGTPPKGGWPLLAWSHGTSGVARGCAPSRMRSLFYNWEGLFEYVTLGYAVVATDYAGLGTAGRHAYLDMLSNGSDVIYSVPAARTAVPQLSKKWIAIGHSQGGLSVLGVAQLEATMNDPEYLGTVSLAGASDLTDGVYSILNSNASILNGLLAFWVYGVKTLYPDLDLRIVLTPNALETYNQSVEHGCSAASGAFSALPTVNLLQPDWQRNHYIQQSLARNRPGVRPVRGPLLLVGGGADALFTVPAGDKIVQRLCSQNPPVTVRRIVLPGLEHDPSVYGSLKDQIVWINDRFAGNPAPNDCSS